MKKAQKTCVDETVFKQQFPDLHQTKVLLFWDIFPEWSFGVLKTQKMRFTKKKEEQKGCNEKLFSEATGLCYSRFSARKPSKWFINKDLWKRNGFHMKLIPCLNQIQFCVVY